MTYSNAVKSIYDLLKQEQLLSIALTKPSRDHIKNELLTILPLLDIRKDYKTLQAYFGHFRDFQELKRIIKNKEGDDFKTVVNFLNGHTQNPSEKVVELSALLINFQPRPEDFKTDYKSVYERLKAKITNRSYELYFNPDLVSHPTENKKETRIENQPIQIITDKVQIQTNEIEQSLPTMDKNIVKKKSKLLNFYNLSGGSIGTILIVFLLSQKTALFENNSLMMASSNNSCMYWDEYEFKTIPCNEASRNQKVFIYDKEKLNIKRIKCWDTITAKSIGRIWYYKIKNEVQFFTAPGPHPENDHLYAKPMTKYMYNKYVLNRDQYNSCNDGIKLSN